MIYLAKIPKFLYNISKINDRHPFCQSAPQIMYQLKKITTQRKVTIQQLIDLNYFSKLKQTQLNDWLELHLIARHTANELKRQNRSNTDFIPYYVLIKMTQINNLHFWRIVITTRTKTQAFTIMRKVKWQDHENLIK